MTRRALPGRELLGCWLLVLALWIQALAPVAMPHGLTAAGPAFDAPLCGEVAAAGDDATDSEQPVPVLPGCGHCPLCCAGIAPPPPPLTRPSRRIPRRQPPSWPIPPPAALQRPPCPPGQPRAPPALA